MSYRDDHMRADALLAPIGVSKEHTRAAALVLAGRARDAAELRDWLEMTGLIPGGQPSRRKPPRGGAGTDVSDGRPGS